MMLIVFSFVLLFIISQFLEQLGLPGGQVSWKRNTDPCEKVAAGEKFEADYTGTILTGSVKLTDVNTAAAAEGTVEAIEAATAALNDGSLKVFATSTFTVEGAELTTYLADVDTDDAYTGDTEVIIDGEFSESTFRSAPYFSLAIDGIEQLNVAF